MYLLFLLAQAQSPLFEDVLFRHAKIHEFNAYGIININNVLLINTTYLSCHLLIP